jgi:multidrug efflux pump
VLSETDLRTPEQFSQLIIREVKGYPVRLRDVGRAELGAADERNILRVNGNPAIGMGIVKQSTANTLGVAKAVKAELPKLTAALPEGMQLAVAFDTSIFIEESINSVYHVLGEALLLVVLVIFLFLRSLRATLIPFVTIPVSLVGAFFLIWIMGFSCSRWVWWWTMPSSYWKTSTAMSRRACRRWKPRSRAGARSPLR